MVSKNDTVSKSRRRQERIVLVSNVYRTKSVSILYREGCIENHDTCTIHFDTLRYTSIHLWEKCTPIHGEKGPISVMIAAQALSQAAIPRPQSPNSVDLRDLRREIRDDGTCRAPKDPIWRTVGEQWTSLTSRFASKLEATPPMPSELGTTHAHRASTNLGFRVPTHPT